MITYRTDLKNKAKYLRNNLSPAEIKLWYEFLKHQPERWYRQKPLLDYIVDFYCPQLKLIIEVDGDTHFEDRAIKYDKERVERLEKFGLKVVRFNNFEVIDDFFRVCEQLLALRQV